MFVHLHDPKRIRCYKLHEDEEGYLALNMNAEDSNGNTILAAVYAKRDTLWELATTILDTLMEDELTEADLSLVDAMSTKLGFVYQDCAGSVANEH